MYREENHGRNPLDRPSSAPQNSTYQQFINHDRSSTCAHSLIARSMRFPLVIMLRLWGFLNPLDSGISTDRQTE
jgi:hypothetical protein